MPRAMAGATGCRAAMEAGCRGLLDGLTRVPAAHDGSHLHRLVCVQLAPLAVEAAATAIMTTDTVITIRPTRMGMDYRWHGCGAGCFAPGLATMLVVPTTDASWSHQSRSWPYVRQPDQLRARRRGWLHVHQRHCVTARIRSQRCRT